MTTNDDRIKYGPHRQEITAVPPIKSYPECKECQCYPECRMDCPDWRQCVERLPEYRERCGLPPLGDTHTP